MSATEEPVLGPKAMAAIDMLRRTGAANIQMRWSDDEQPVVWFAVVQYRIRAGRPVAEGPVNKWETAAGRDITEALLRLCERMVDEWLTKLATWTGQPPISRIVLAWGAEQRKPIEARAAQVLELLKPAGEAGRCWVFAAAGKTPHPLYLKNETPLVRV